MTNPVRTWDFTAHDVAPVEDVKALLKLHCKEWAFQLEEGNETKKQHYQGRFRLKEKLRIDGVKKLLKVNWHLSITSEKCTSDFDYVIKSDTRIAGPWTSQDKYIPRQIREITCLRPWQQQIIDSASVWDTRTINVVVDPQGNRGKSILKTYAGVKGIGRALPYINDYRDIMRIVMDTPKVPLYIIDIPRAIPKEKMFQFFSGIETLKDGYAYDDRYHFREEYFDCPNIWIFVNVEPDNSVLSKDRWVFWEFNDKNELIKAY